MKTKLVILIMSLVAVLGYSQLSVSITSQSVVSIPVATNTVTQIVQPTVFHVDLTAQEIDFGYPSSTNKNAHIVWKKSTAPFSAVFQASELNLTNLSTVLSQYPSQTIFRPSIR